MAITPLATSAIRFNVQETSIFSAAIRDNKKRYERLSKAAMEAEAKKDMENFKNSGDSEDTSIEMYLARRSPFKTFEFKGSGKGQYVRPGGKQLVLFTDPKTQERILTHLTEDNLEKLRSKFGASDFYYRDDGIMRITGEAEELLGGWLQDIAYNQGYLEADENKDLVIESLDGEGANLKIGAQQTLGYKMQNGRVVEIFAKETKGYLQGADIFLMQSGKVETTFEERFNNFIEKDENLDGEMTNIEYFGGKEKIIEYFQEIQAAQVENKEEIIEGIENAIAAEHAFEELEKADGAAFRLSAQSREALSKAAPIFRMGFERGEIFNFKFEMPFIRSDLNENIAKLLQQGGNQARLADITKHVYAVSLTEAEEGKEKPLVQQLHEILHMLKTDSVGGGTSVNLIA
ncbi:MAG: hypothetical protein K2N70_08395 [Helicobacter sp.]|nr:hypothetical protein [Helicobacter sp.]